MRPWVQIKKPERGFPTALRHREPGDQFPVILVCDTTSHFRREVVLLFD
ncbi:MAG: hypothetical protein ABSB87_07260 [Terriglobales bacterium]|jgi:hypothetical protein